MSPQPLWLSVETVIALNKRIVEHTSEPFGIAIPGAIESAVARPEQHFNYGPDDEHDDLVVLGAKLCVGVARSHGFRQGNKRTGLAVMEMFLNQNGYTLAATDVPRLARLIYNVVEHRLSEHDFIEEIDAYITELRMGEAVGLMLHELGLSAALPGEEA
jgi:death-on-curing protein